VLAVPASLFAILKEILRHLLGRPVVGVSVIARTPAGQLVLIKRGDTHLWALPGGTVEWGEDLRATAVRELLEEAGIRRAELGNLCGVYSHPGRDPRFHAVTILVEATVAEPEQPPYNPAEIVEVRLFAMDQLPLELSHGNREMLDRALSGKNYWE
jgi:8-oxo-dGTP diphosphatase